MERKPYPTRSPAPEARRAASPDGQPLRDHGGAQAGAAGSGHPAAPGPGLVPSGLDAFWLEADQQASAEHPIERELVHRLDALARYGELIDGALAEGRDRAAELLLRQREREEAIVRRLRQALRRTRGQRG